MLDSSPGTSAQIGEEPYCGPPATVHLLALGDGDAGSARRWMEVRAREYTFRLLYDPQADPAQSGRSAAIALAAYTAQQLIGAEHRECEIAFLFDTRTRLLGFYRVARGSLNVVRSTVSDVAFPALQLGARSVVLAHNHPSGDPTPSRADWNHAEAIAMGLQYTGVELMGAVVVAVPGWRTVWERPSRREWLTCDTNDDPGDRSTPAPD